MAVLGGALFRVARALGRADTRRLLAVDHRPPVLYLRSFDDDTLPLATIASARRPFFELLSFRGRDPFEESVAWELATYGPVVAVGRPGRSLASLGAAREHLSDDTWKAQVAGRMHDARAIALAAGETPGLHWEVAQVVAAGHLAKTVFILPPLPADALARRWAFTSAALASAGAVVDQLPADVGLVHTVQVGADGRVAVTTAHQRDEASYRTAVDRAMVRVRSAARRASAASVAARRASAASVAPGRASAASVAASVAARRRGCAAPVSSVVVAFVVVAPLRLRAPRSRHPAASPPSHWPVRRRHHPDGRRADAAVLLRPADGFSFRRGAGTARPRGWPGPGARWACIGAVTKRAGRSRKAAQHRGPAGPPRLVVDVGVLGPHAGHVGLVAGGLRGQDGQVGVQHDRGRR